MSSIIFVTTSRCESVNLPLRGEQAAVLAALDRLGRDADLSYSPRMAILPPTTPIEPVIVPGAAMILSAPIAM